MTWILMAAISVGAFFFGRYYRSEAKKWQQDAMAQRKAYVQAKADATDVAARYEGVIADLKSRLTQLEEQIYASDDPTTVRNLFGQLFPPPAKP